MAAVSYLMLPACQAVWRYVPGWTLGDQSPHRRNSEASHMQWSVTLAHASAPSSKSRVRAGQAQPGMLISVTDGTPTTRKNWYAASNAIMYIVATRQAMQPQQFAKAMLSLPTITTTT